MNKFFAFALMAILSTVAHAGSLNFDFRFDYLSEGYNDDAVTAGAGANNSRFMVQTGRLDYKGKLNEDTSFRVRARLAGKDQGAVSKVDNANITLDYAYIANKTGDTVLTVGKMNSDIGGFEGITTGPDLYLLSEAYNGTTYLKSVNTGFVNLIYAPGAKVAYTSGNHELSVMAFNANSNVGRNTVNDLYETTGTLGTGKPNTTTMLVGVVYKGWFMDKNLGVMLSQHMETLAKDTSGTFTAAGLQYKMDKTMLQFDYLINSTAYVPSSGPTTATDKITSMVLKLTYDFNELSDLQLKVVSSQEDLDPTGALVAFTNKFMSYGLAYEWKAKKDDNFRYHLAYNSRTFSPDSKISALSPNQTQLILGARIYADFLK